jgi:ankyrin repeat protein
MNKYSLISSYATHDPALVSYLLQQGANPNLGPGAGRGPGDPKFLELVPGSGAILRSAAQNGSIESLDLLLAHGAELSNAATLHAAVEGKSHDMLAHLLNLGVDVDQKDSYQTMGLPLYTTPLLRAIVRGKPDAVKFLLDNGAKTMKRVPPFYRTPFSRSKTALDLVKEDGVSIDIRAMVEEVGERGEVDPEIT